MDGHKFESLEIIVDNEQGLIVERTIALRPYPALKLFRDAMYASLKDKLPADVWDYPKPYCDQDGAFQIGSNQESGWSVVSYDLGYIGLEEKTLLRCWSRIDRCTNSRG